jgi:preprotein translocase subunit YajC
MDKFLLLRDNKQTGPYSAAELEKMGLKSYDLIWQEGRSAAWRYPGEIPALKSFAPPVEEQPYDRFYKKEPQSIPEKEPEITPVPKKEETARKHNSAHIFVSVPVKAPVSKSEKKELPVSESHHAAYLPKVHDQSFEPAYVPDPSPQKVLTHQSYEKPTSSVQTKERGIRPVHWMSAALVLFALLSTFLFVNYRQQHKQLNRLNEIVLNMQQDQQVSSTPIHNAVAPVIRQESSIIDTLGFTPMNYEKKSDPEPVATVKKTAPKNSLPKKDSVPAKNPEPVTEEMNQVTENSAPVRISRKRNVADQIKVMTNDDFKVGFLGGISNLQVTLANNSDRPMNKVQVLVEYLSKENKVVKTQEINFNKVEAGAQLTKDVPRTARGITVRCKIGSVDPADSVATNDETKGKTP